MDDIIMVAVVFFGSIVACCVVCWLVIEWAQWIDKRNPMNRARRNINGRKRMATDWKRPDYLPGDWE